MNDARFDAAALQGRTAHTMFGIVSAVDPVNHAVKVRIQPENIETGWISDACGVHAGIFGLHVRLLRECMLFCNRLREMESI